jgi:hypothetical protein
MACLTEHRSIESAIVVLRAVAQEAGDMAFDR